MTSVSRWRYLAQESLNAAYFALRSKAFPQYLKSSFRFIRSRYALEKKIRPKATLNFEKNNNAISLKQPSEQSLWMKSFNDREDSYRLHRFGWMLSKLAEDPSSVSSALTYVMDWLDFQKNSKAGGLYGWDSYSLSERIVSWLYLIEKLEGAGRYQTEINEIAKSLQYQLYFLSQHLERRGERTNNHLINNGRALYLGGLLLKEPEIQRLGEVLLTEESKNMFTPPGFLREASTHYHLLITRNYLEALWFARQKRDKIFSERISPMTYDMWKCACFILQEDPFPIVGDISPDFSPNFNRGVVQVGEHLFGEKSGIPLKQEKGWHSLLLGEEAHLTENSPFPSGIVGFEKAGYYRLRNESFSLFIFVNPFGYIPAWSHGHADLGSFVLYFRSQPLIQGTGRPTYENTPLGRYGRSVRSHNSISIDRHEPCVVHGMNGIPEMMGESYLQAPPQIKMGENRDRLRLEIEYYGFKRWIPNAVVRRIFELSPKGLTLTDEIAGSGKHFIETFFHFDPRVQISSNQDSVVSLHLPHQDHRLQLFRVPQASSGELELIRGRNGNGTAGWHFPEYGVSEPTTTAIFRQRTSLPLRHTYTLHES